MVIVGNVMEGGLVEGGIPPGSPVSQIFFAIYTPRPIQWVQQRVSVIKGFSCMDDVGWIATGRNVSQVIRKLAAWARECIDWEERRVLEFDTPKSEVALFTQRQRHRQHHQPMLTSTI